MLYINKSDDFSGKGKDIFIQNIGVEITKLLNNPDIKDRKQLRDIQLHLSDYLQRRSSSPDEISRYLSRVKTHLTKTYGGKTRKHKLRDNRTKKQKNVDKHQQTKKKKSIRRKITQTKRQTRKQR